MSAREGEVVARHTPGPWCVENPFGPDDLAIMPAGKPTHEWVIIATVSHDDDKEPPFISEDERDANARLIATAPDLRDALACLLMNVVDADMSEEDIARHHNWIFAKVVTAARAALSRAGGV